MSVVAARDTVAERERVMPVVVERSVVRDFVREIMSDARGADMALRVMVPDDTGWTVRGRTAPVPRTPTPRVSVVVAVRETTFAERDDDGVETVRVVVVDIVRDAPPPVLVVSVADAFLRVDDTVLVAPRRVAARAISAASSAVAA